jgi:hypothetical protein
MDDYLTPFEVEHHVNELKEIEVEQYGSPEWYK